MGIVISPFLFATSEHPQNRDRTTLREWGVKSGDTLTIQVPEPLPSHVKVELGFEFVDYANSKLHGQDTLIFIVDLDTETILSLSNKVAARLDSSPGRIDLTPVNPDQVDHDDYDTLHYIGIVSGDTFKCRESYLGP